MQTDFKLVDSKGQPTSWFAFIVDTEEPYIIIRDDENPLTTTKYLKDQKELEIFARNILKSLDKH